ncbi:hypothetical protein ACNT2N_21965 [Pseudomonas thivervalensis]|uniref:Uncharacterized protein n=1 Tax=Pseudomonas thivervalensis TaxID=86265 RepID=A0A2Z4Z5N8_9PSED|nr:hypothetical protein [Pseudomonas thivervalensis]AXA53289.1 hypothetical protein CE140_02580 [Pseudomonas thivervalensis]AXA60977.1 hypothetical protein CEQ51_13165 [Pseudomonas thivervalensis]
MKTSLLNRLLLLILLFSPPLFAQDSGAVYFTMGVHNTEGCNEQNGNCIAKRIPGEPSDPFFPAYWISDWTMYRVMHNYEKNPPPYSNPPTTLTPADYTVSHGTSYYDTAYIPADGDGFGAMMEHYEKYCLPIFPIKNNNYTCSFVSLGNKAYFLTYPQDRPKDMPACCMFSPMNHPPRQDFIQHLPYSAERSQNLDGSVQAYALDLQSPQGPILFGYAFYKKMTGQPPYRQPQSFFFSGDTSVANAPIVSQNYTNFRIARPDPTQTWGQVAAMCPANPPPCQLFEPPASQSNGQKAQWNKLMQRKP